MNSRHYKTKGKEREKNHKELEEELERIFNRQVSRM